MLTYSTSRFWVVIQEMHLPLKKMMLQQSTKVLLETTKSFATYQVVFIKLISSSVLTTS